MEIMDRVRFLVITSLGMLSLKMSEHSGRHTNTRPVLAGLIKETQSRAPSYTAVAKEREKFK